MFKKLLGVLFKREQVVESVVESIIADEIKAAFTPNTEWVQFDVGAIATKLVHPSILSITLDRDRGWIRVESITNQADPEFENLLVKVLGEGIVGTRQVNEGTRRPTYRFLIDTAGSKVPMPRMLYELNQYRGYDTYEVKQVESGRFLELLIKKDQFPVMAFNRLAEYGVPTDYLRKLPSEETGKLPFYVLSYTMEANQLNLNELRLRIDQWLLMGGGLATRE